MSNKNKYCPRCKNTKLLTQFYKRRADEPIYPSNTSHICKECKLIELKLDQKANPAKWANYNRKFALKHPGYSAATTRKWRNKQKMAHMNDLSNISIKAKEYNNAVSFFDRLETYVEHIKIKANKAAEHGRTDITIRLAKYDADLAKGLHLRFLDTGYEITIEKTQFGSVYFKINWAIKREQAHYLDAPLTTEFKIKHNLRTDKTVTLRHIKNIVELGGICAWIVSDELKAML
jgi:hypothetical protein